MKGLAFTFFYPDFTVGSGIKPDLLLETFLKSSRAVPPVGNYGSISDYKNSYHSPCPEDFLLAIQLFLLYYPFMVL